MNRLASVIFFRILRTTIYSTTALTFCSWIVQSSKYLTVLNNNLSLADFFRFTSLLIVDVVAFILPIALAVSAGFVFHRMAGSHQITVLQSSGIAPQKLLAPLVWLSLIITGYLYVSNAYISPLSWRKFRQIEFNIRNNVRPPNNAGQIFCGNNFSVYAQEYLGDLIFKNIFIVDTRIPNKSFTLFAALGSIENNILALQAGERVEVDFVTHKNSVTEFISYSYDLKEIISFERQQAHSNEKFPSQLLKEIPNDASKTREQRALFHQKILSPIWAIIFPLLAFFLIGLAPYVRKITYFRMGILIGIIIITQGLFLSFANLSAGNDLFIYVNYLFIAVMLLVSILCVREHE